MRRWIMDVIIYKKHGRKLFWNRVWEYKSYKCDLKRGELKHLNYLMTKDVTKEHSEVFPLFDKYGIPLQDLGLTQMR